MFRFGSGNYFNGYLKDKDGEEYLFEPLSEATRLALLSDPPQQDCVDMLNAMLVKAAIEFKNIVENHIPELIAAAKAVTYKQRLSVKPVDVDGEPYFYLNLHHIAPLNLIYELMDESNNNIGYLIVGPEQENQSNVTYTIVSEANLVVSSAMQLPALKILTKGKVHLAGDWHVDQVSAVYAHKLTVDTQKEIEFHCPIISLNTEQACVTAGNFYCNDYQVAAGDYQGYARVVTDKALVRAENTTHHADIYARKTIHSLALNQQGESHLHAPAGVFLVSGNLILNGAASSAEAFKSRAKEARYNCQIYCPGETLIQTEQTAQVTSTAKFVLHGKVYAASHWALCQSGGILYTPKVKVEWLKVTDPTQTTPPLLTSSDSKANELQIVPQEPKTEVYYEDYLPTKQQERKEKSISLEAGISLKMDGVIVADEAPVFIQGGHVEIDGNIWQQSLYENFPLAIKAHCLRQNGNIYASVAAQIATTKQFTQSGLLASPMVSISGNYHLEAGAELQALVAAINVNKKLSDEEVVFAKDSKVNVQNNLLVRARNISNYTNLQATNMAFEATRCVYNAGNFGGNTVYVLASRVISTGKLSASSISINAYFSYIHGINFVKNFNNNSLLSIHPGFFATWMQIPRNPATWLMLPFNIACLAVSTAFPPAAPYALITQISVNRLASLFAGGNMLKQIYQQAKQVYNDDEADILNILRLVTCANQVGMTFAYGAFATVSGINAVSTSLDTAASAATAINSISKDVLLPVAMKSVPYVLSTFSGSSNFSLISIRPQIAFAFADTEYNGISIDPGIFFKVTAIKNTLLHLDANYTAALGPVSENTLLFFSCGDTFPVLGSYALSTYGGAIYSWLPVSHQNWNVQSPELVLAGTGIFVNSVVNSNHLDNTGRTLFANSNVKIEELNDENQLQLVHTHGQIGHTQVAKDGLYVEDGCEVNTNKLDIEKGAKARLTASNETIKELNNSSDSVEVYDSVISGDKITNQGKIHTDHTLLSYKQSDGKLGRSDVSGNDSVFYTDKTNKHKMSGLSNISHLATDEEKKIFKDKLPQYSVHFRGGKVMYETNGAVALSNRTYYSMVPISYHGSTVQTSGNIAASAGLDLVSQRDMSLLNTVFSLGGNSNFHTGGNLRMEKSKVACAGHLNEHADKTLTVKESSGVAESMDFSGDEGTQMDPGIRVEKHTSTHWRWHGLNSGVEKTIDIKTIITPNAFEATSGNIHVASKKGSIVTHATDFMGNKIYFDAEKDVLLYDMKGGETHQKKEWALTGYSSEKQVYQTSTPSALLMQHNVFIDARHGHVDATGAIIHAPDGIFVHAEGTIRFARSVLYNHYESFQAGLLRVDFPLANFANDPLSYMPLYNAGREFTNAQGSINKAFAAADALATTINKTHALLAAMKHEMSFWQQASDFIFNPHFANFLAQVNLTFGIRRQEADWETLGPGDLQTNELHLKAKHVEFANAYGVDAKHVVIDADTADLSGAQLHASTHTSEASATVGVGLGGINSVSGNLQQADGHSTQVVAMQPNVETFEANVRELNLHNVDLPEDKITCPGKITATHDASRSDMQLQSLGVSGQGMSYTQQHDTMVDQHQQSSRTAVAVDFAALGGSANNDVFSFLRYQHDNVVDGHKRTQTVAIPVVNPNELAQFKSELEQLANPPKPIEEHLPQSVIVSVLPEVENEEKEKPHHTTKKKSAPTKPKVQHQQENPYALTADDIFPTKSLDEEVVALCDGATTIIDNEEEPETKPKPVKSTATIYVVLNNSTQKPAAQPRSWKQRGLGALQMLGGGAEVVAGATMDATLWETGVGAVAGTAMITSGLDNFVTGAGRLISGREQRTAIVDGLAEAGLDPEIAAALQTSVDIISPFGAAYKTIQLTAASERTIAAGLRQNSLFSEGVAPAVHTQSRQENIIQLVDPKNIPDWAMRSFTSPSFRELPEGTLIYQVIREGQLLPGEYYSLYRAHDALDAEIMFNIKTWGNNADILTINQIIKPGLSTWSGGVLNGTGRQLFIPSNIQGHFIRELDREYLYKPLPTISIIENVEPYLLVKPLLKK